MGRGALSVADAVRSVGVEIGADVHTGEVEVRGDDLGGLAVHIGARVAAAAAPGQLFASSTARDMLRDRRSRSRIGAEHALKGVPGTWRLFAVTQP